MSHRRIKTLGAPVQSSGERKFSLGVLSGRGGAEAPFHGIILSEGEGREPMWAIESQGISCP